MPIFPAATEAFLKSSSCRVRIGLLVRPVLNGAEVLSGDLECDIEASWCRQHERFEAHFHFVGKAPFPSAMDYNMTATAVRTSISSSTLPLWRSSARSPGYSGLPRAAP